MPILADCHLHSHHSGDSETPMEDMIKKALEAGLRTLCFTEHNDFDFPDTPEGPGAAFTLNTDSYLYELLQLKEKYADRIQLLFGVELGLQPQVFRQNAVYANCYDFDFIIGSAHVCRGMDPYYPAFFEGRCEEEAYREYFESIYRNIRRFQNFDVCGHLDYVVRYGPNKDREYSYDRYRDIFDKILTFLIDEGKGLEVNTGGVKSGLAELHPCTDILKRYRQLGGELVTVGSDAHTPNHIGAYFDRAAAILKDCGFGYYCIYEKRTPHFHKLT